MRLLDTGSGGGAGMDGTLMHARAADAYTGAFVVFNGLDTYVRLPAMTLAGDLTVAFRLRFYSLSQTMLLFEFGNGYQADTIKFWMTHHAYLWLYQYVGSERKRAWAYISDPNGGGRCRARPGCVLPWGRRFR